MTGTTSRFLETAFLLDISAGACLFGRLKSRWSLRPALRSNASLSCHISAPPAEFAALPSDLNFSPCSDGRRKVAWAFAKAPNDMDVASSFSDSELESTSSSCHNESESDRQVHG
jgi:hypothetical protein